MTKTTPLILDLGVRVVHGAATHNVPLELLARYKLQKRHPVLSRALPTKGALI